MSLITSLYIHIPFCLSKCKYCDFFSVTCKDKSNPISDDYITSLLNELLYKIKKYDIKTLKTIYIGGGSPSLLSKNQLEKFFSFIENYLTFEKDYEFTIEVNPDDITKDFILFLQNSKINRISIGIQSMNNKVLRYVKRRSSKKQNQNALKIIKKYWKKEFSLDLICALPKQTQISFLHTLKHIIKYRPHHISMYSLTIESETPLGQELENNILNYDFDKADKMWLKGKGFLEKNGYAQYEVSNFCQKGHECVHNKVYWSHESYLGVGAGAAQTIYIEDGSAMRSENLSNIEKYIEVWGQTKNILEKNINQVTKTEKIDKQISKFEFFMMGLRKTKGVSDLEYKSIFAEEIPQSVIKQFTKWQEKKLASIIQIKNPKNTQIETFYCLSSKGFLFLNTFLSELEI